MGDKPHYPFEPIASSKTLAKTLGVNLPLLLKTASNTSNSYTSFIVPTKSKDRTVYEPKTTLKYIQKKINKEILSRVEFPSYLMGGIKDTQSPRDYLANSRMHLRKESLINLDIENFYHSIKKPYATQIFKQLFKFNDEVSNLLTELVTLDGQVPQGACTSSYIANLVFFNSEYTVVNNLRAKKIAYTRLLDDITLSADRKLTNIEKEWLISQVTGMIVSHELKIKDAKTRIENRDHPRSRYEVTGAWVKYGEPKLRKKERNKIRHDVYICELFHEKDPTTEEYHRLWNRTSGLVSKLGRFNHKNEADKLRKRLSFILPKYSDIQAKTLQTKIYQIVNRKKKNNIDINNPGLSKQILRFYHNLGILSRTHPHLSKPLKNQLRSEFGTMIRNEYY
ncbi:MULTISPECIES: reverse transcriptase family protein [unclassified Halomonas]|uniref:reverse transcriptase family protein n=1 Tax=unclassified Halomonas TaxID=2609666 RepID=UPI0004B05132|nr:MULTISPECIES: reverse transcriptase family protein [unclassified Halomonas]PKH60745.1 RNA-directed DNA polymerase [Halomonas sp. Choline-3u-9]QGQ72137.1 RNA-directed DNA polymerase [Halomonas sp. PA16-9]|tara:strand:+ start:1004 stop:2185 length:1182 start_codon:yes stop_codon:yes gene_type:complete